MKEEAYTWVFPNQQTKTARPVGVEQMLYSILVGAKKRHHIGEKNHPPNYASNIAQQAQSDPDSSTKEMLCLAVSKSEICEENLQH